ncbi:acyltransferase [Fictibacillus nanhaiensis]|uniref:acyltransferase n=1 Tax=Fictibacillus nanhaiensis TaxID=742169 RepID=UPI001C96464D|nr:acyltransferase [Fictibacillus nanhaiensis]MBY6035812.1 acyltransferase [Fictibacillus nanhaiensis]
MERIYSIDFIKFFAIFAVVVIHVFPLDGFMGYYVIDNVARFAVPFFFVASGYFFAQNMSKQKSSFRYFKTYVLKLIKIYLSWLIFYTFYDVMLIFLNGNDVSDQLIEYFKPFTLLNLIYYGKGTSGYQLWFLTALIWSTVTIFLFFQIKKMNTLFGISFVLNVIGLLGQSYTFVFKLPVNTTRDALFFGLFYTTLGVIFKLNTHFDTFRKISRFTSLALAIFFSLFQVIEAYVLDKVLTGSHGEYFLSTTLLTTFLFFYALNNKKLGKGLWITKVGGNALGIYITHVLLLDVFNRMIKYLGLEYLSDLAIWNICYTLFIFTASYKTYHVLQKIKFRVKQP